MEMMDLMLQTWIWYHKLFVHFTWQIFHECKSLPLIKASRVDQKLRGKRFTKLDLPIGLLKFPKERPGKILECIYLLGVGHLGIIGQDHILAGRVGSVWPHGELGQRSRLFAAHVKLFFFCISWRRWKRGREKRGKEKRWRLGVRRGRIDWLWRKFYARRRENARVWRTHGHRHSWHGRAKARARGERECRYPAGFFRVSHTGTRYIQVAVGNSVFSPKGHIH